MDYKDTLTILIPLWGRYECTLRILNHMSDTNMPFKILLADGGGTDLKDKLNKKTYPNLNLEYVNFGHDTTIHEFMAKMNKACSMIDTPLTIMLDNDDFLSVNGLINGVKFLNENKDYSSYRGNVRCIKSDNPVYRQPANLNDTSLGRLKFPDEGLNSGWHDIIRTYTLKKFFEILDKSNTNDLQLVYSVNRYWHTMYGYGYKDSSTPYYYHIHGQSLVWDKGLYSPTSKWFVDENFVDSMGINISMVYNLIHEENKITGLDGRVIIAKRIVGHLAELNAIKPKDFNIVDKKVVESVLSSYDYDELILSVLNKEDKNISFDLSGVLPEISLDYKKDRATILNHIDI
tara:strand:- start:43 stop:1080 length:1038 start_codon:yes stop_codon:yes gene_type:complete